MKVVWRSVAALGSIALTSVTYADPAAAEASGAGCRAGAPHLSLRVTSDADDLSRTIRIDIADGMRRRGLAVCGDDAAREGSVGQLRVDARDPASVVITMIDDITNKEVTRRLDLSELPADGHSLAIAIAAEELARASWAELALGPVTAERPAARVRPPRRGLGEALPETQGTDGDDANAAPGRNAVRVAAGVEHYTTSLTLLGPDVAYRRHLVGWLWFEGGGLFRAGLGVDAARGRIDTLAAGGQLALVARAVDSGRFALDVDAGARARWVRFDGDARADAVEDRFSTWAALVRAGASIGVRPSAPLELSARVGAGLPVRAVFAGDGGRDATGVGGVALSTSLGLGVVF
ncbi:MAG: hypothetical protein AAGN82_24240 [Myxococcota bacterium]